MAHMLELPGYAMYENPGVPASCTVGKWGIVIALRKGFQLKCQLEISHSLCSWALALDIVVTSPCPCVQCLICIYAPWDVGNPLCLTFWTEIHSVVGQAPLPDVWMVLGDFNAVLRAKERVSSTASVSTHPYQQFLSSTGALDLWMLKGHINI